MTVPGRGLLEKIGQRALEGWRDAAASAVAAGLAWLVAQHLFGHPQPLFAAISAIICLAPGLPSHGKQAIGLLIGVATGIVVGELTLFLSDQWPVLRLGLSAFVAIAVASVYGLPAVVPIQAGVSAILVLTFGPQTGGPVRMLDVAVGAVVGLFFSQVLLTPNPTRMIDEAARDLFDQLAAGLGKCAHALQKRDPAKAEAGLRNLSAAHKSVVQLDAGIQTARSAVRWSLRGRLAAREVDVIAQRYDREAIRLYASALLLGEATANALREINVAVPEGLYERMRDASVRCAAIASGKAVDGRPTGGTRSEPPGWSENVPAPWRSCVDHMASVEQAITAFDRTIAVDTRGSLGASST